MAIAVQSFRSNRDVFSDDVVLPVDTTDRSLSKMTGRANPLELMMVVVNRVSFESVVRKREQ